MRLIKQKTTNDFSEQRGRCVLRNLCTVTPPSLENAAIDDVTSAEPMKERKNRQEGCPVHSFLR